jgi:hypothetical protein
MKIWILFSLVLICLSTTNPPHVSALSYNYDVTGNASVFTEGWPTDTPPTSQTIWGSMSINSSPIITSQIGAIGRCYFNIESFELTIGDGYHFSGNGQIYFNFINNPNGTISYSGDDWHLVGSGNWSEWWGENVFSLSDNGQLLNLSALESLIGLGFVSPSMTTGDVPILIGGNNTGLTLSRIDPVPEPSTSCLFVIGVLGILLMFRKKSMPKFKV